MVTFDWWYDRASRRRWWMPLEVDVVKLDTDKLMEAFSRDRTKLRLRLNDSENRVTELQEWLIMAHGHVSECEAQLAALTADKESLSVRIEVCIAAVEAWSKQVETLTAERDSALNYKGSIIDALKVAEAMRQERDLAHQAIRLLLAWFDESPFIEQPVDKLAAAVAALRSAVAGAKPAA